MALPISRFQRGLCFLAVAGLFYLLRHLFYVIFLTFVLAYMIHSLQRPLTRRFPYRRFNIVLLYLLILSLGLCLGSFVLPQVAMEAGGLVKHYLDHNLEDRQEVLHAFETSVREARGRARPAESRRKNKEAPPAESRPALPDAPPFAYHPLPGPVAPRTTVPVPATPEPMIVPERVIIRVIEVRDTAEATDTESILDHEIRGYLDAGTILLVGREYADRFRATEIHDRIFASTRDMIADIIPRIISPFTALINSLPIIFLESLLGLVLSFLILWDLPMLQLQIAAALKRTDIAAILETATLLNNLGSTIGRAFEAQSVIAVVNTIVTAVGFAFIGLPSVLFLSTLVFFCSFVPIFGVLISTLPAGILAFKIGGIGKVLLLVGIILIVHTLETYVLDPMIYGYHLHIHPVVALVVLVVAEHFLGVWGLLLGIPVVTFVLKSAFPPSR